MCFSTFTEWCTNWNTKLQRQILVVLPIIYVLIDISLIWLLVDMYWEWHKISMPLCSCQLLSQDGNIHSFKLFLSNTLFSTNFWFFLLRRVLFQIGRQRHMTCVMFDLCQIYIVSLNDFLKWKYNLFSSAWHRQVRLEWENFGYAHLGIIIVPIPSIKWTFVSRCATFQNMRVWL